MNDDDAHRGKARAQYRSAVRTLALVVAAVVVVLLAAVGVAGAHPWSGPVVLELAGGHGMHRGDVPVLAVSAVLLTWIGLLSRR